APAGRGRKLKSDRAYAGRIWARKPGGVNVASPDLGSNHEDGRAVDIHPAAIQNWFKRNGRLYGWSWDEGKRVGENWHFRYVPSLDQMKHEGLLDHAAVQRVVGATVDGKIGTGTVAKIKSWQKADGLTAGGKVGAGRKRRGGLTGEGDGAAAQGRREGLLDHAAGQRVVGATGDGKIGTGTVAKIKSWQKAHGLTADGKVGAGTKRAMGLTGKGDAAPAPVIPVGPVGGASVPAP